MKKIIKKFWKKNRPMVLFFVVIVLTLIFTFLWVKIILTETPKVERNLMYQEESAGAGEVFASLNVNTNEVQNLKISNRVAQEAEALTLNEKQKNFDELSFITSPDGHSIAYIVIDPKSNKKTVSLNGKTGASYDEITFMKFSDNGKRFAYGAKVNNKALVVLDGKEGKVYDWVFEPYFFSPDNQYLIYKARDSRGDVLVFNTWESKIYDRIYNVTVNGNESELIFYARKGDKIWQGVVHLDMSKDLE